MKESGIDKSQIDEVILCGGSSKIPRIRKIITDFFNGKILNTSINPDEAVAEGATLMAAQMQMKVSGQSTDMVLVTEVNPLSFGVKTAGDKMEFMIKKNSKMPCSHKKTFANATANQTKVKV